MKHQKNLVGWLVFSAALLTHPLTAAAQIPNADVSADVSDVSMESAAEPATYIGREIDVIEQSPVLQRWLQKVPDVRTDIRDDPSFVTRVQAGYSVFPSSDGKGGFAVGVEDWFVGSTPLTISADYQQNFKGDRGASPSEFRQAYGADLHYYVLPLGGYFNVAPTLGYRHAESANNYSVSGANVGLRLRFVPSRTGAADFTVNQSWIVGGSEGLSITQLNFGYAVTQTLRLSTDLEWQSTADKGDSRVGINLEWSP